MEVKALFSSIYKALNLFSNFHKSSKKKIKKNSTCNIIRILRKKVLFWGVMMDNYSPTLTVELFSTVLHSWTGNWMQKTLHKMVARIFYHLYESRKTKILM